MDKRDWSWPRIIVGLVLLGGVIMSAVWLYPLARTERDEVLPVVGELLQVVAGLLALLLLVSGRRSADSQSVDDLAKRLADEVRERSKKTATQQRLMKDEERGPAPIPIRWSLSDLDVAGPVAAAVEAPKFSPLPEFNQITKAQLQAGGWCSELHALYAGLDSGRVVVVGAPGAGKSGAAIMLLLDALDHRDRLNNEADRNRTPVPVLLNTQGWNPRNCSIHNWLISQLVANYSVFWRRGEGVAEATKLVDGGKVALILDGFDEIEKELRSDALQALNDARFRVVVFARRPEMNEAASVSWLAGAVTVELCEVTASDAANYLERALRTRKPSASWKKLIDSLREQPKDTLADALSSPLTITLLRAIYQPKDEFHELFDSIRARNPQAIRWHLFDIFLRVAYSPDRQGRKRPHYEEKKARRALTIIARKMGKERDLAWWRISEWEPTTTFHILATGFVFGLGGWLVSWFGVGPMSGLGVGLGVGLVSGILGGLSSWFVSKLRNETPQPGVPQRGAPRRVRIAKWRNTISNQARVKGPVVGRVVGLLKGLWDGLRHEESQLSLILNWRFKMWPRVQKEGLVVGVVGWVVGGVVIGIVGDLRGGPLFGFATGFVGGFAVGLVFGLTYVFFEGGAGEGGPLSPYEIWRNDRIAGIVGGVASGLVVGLVSWIVGGPVFGIVSGIVGGALFALTYPEIWPTTLAWLQLRHSDHVPFFRLMCFLEDARERNVLRTVGAVYQFRHATLQDYLIDQSTPDSEVSRVS